MLQRTSCFGNRVRKESGKRKYASGYDLGVLDCDWPVIRSPQCYYSLILQCLRQECHGENQRSCEVACTNSCDPVFFRCWAFYTSDVRLVCLRSTPFNWTSLIQLQAVGRLKNPAA